MTRIVLTVLFLFVNTAWSAEPVVVIDFSKGNPANYLADEDSKDVQVVDENNGKTLVFSDSSILLRDLKIKTATKYTLTLEASFEGKAESFEENSRFEYLNQPGHPNSRLPSHEIRFFDTAGKAVARPLLFTQPFRKSRIYQNVFYSPREAATARIKLTSGKELQLKVSQLKLAETRDEAALNSNPRFALGLSNYSGWKNIADGGKLIERDGKIVLDTKYGSTGQMIPLTEPGTYGFAALATPNGYNSTVIIRVYDAAGKELMRTATRKYGPPIYFVPPREAVSASFLVYSCLLEEMRLFRAGDEGAITNLQKQ